MLVSNLLVGIYQGPVKVVDEYLAGLKVHEYGTAANKWFIIGIIFFWHPGRDGIH